MHIGRPLELRWVSERHLRLGGPALADAAVIHATAQRVRQAGIPGVVDLSPAHSTILVEFDGIDLDSATAELALRDALTDLRAVQSVFSRCVEIPACFDPQFGPDLAAIAEHSGRSIAAFVESFVAASYSVRFLGFVPGFAYLDGLPTTLAMPRRASPRPRVEAGSVAVAAGQTGIYPVTSPGGWQLVGRTPLRMFDPRREPPVLLHTCDEVRFLPISPADFERIAREQP